MKLICLMLTLMIIGCSKSPEQTPSYIFEYKAGQGNLLGNTNLGDVVYNYATILSLKIVNVGTDPLVGPAMVNNNNFKIVYSSGCSLIPINGACLLKVSFDAKNKEPGLIESVLSLDNFAISLTANVLPEPSVVNSNSEVKYYLGNNEVMSVDYGTLSDKQNLVKSISIKNTGNQVVNSQVISNENFILIYDTCSNKDLRPKNNCLIKVSFNGSNKNGNYTGSIQYAGKSLNLMASVVPVSLNPTGNIQIVTTLSNQLVTEISDFLVSGSKQYVLNLKNIGTKPSSLLSLSLNNSNFSMIFNQCNKVLNPGSSCQVRITFSTSGKTLGSTYSSLLVAQDYSFPLSVSLNPITQPCDLADAESNGFDISKALNPLGTKNGGNVSQCLISCISNYQLDFGSKKCLVNLDEDNNGIVNEEVLTLLLNDAQSGYISSEVSLPGLIYEVTDQINIPSNITIQATDPLNKPLFRKKNELFSGIDKTQAQTIKTIIEANLPFINFNGEGDVTGYNGVSSVEALQTAKDAILNYLDNNQLLDSLVVTYGNKKLRFDVEGHGTKCKNNTTGESYVCPTTIPANTNKFTPFYQEIINTPASEFSMYHKHTSTPIFYVNSNNVVLKNLKIQCPNEVPYFPVHEMVNISPSYPNGQVSVVNGKRVVSGFAGNGVYLFRSSNSILEGLEIENCSLGIYSINSHNITIENNQVLTNVKTSSIRPLVNKEIGDFGVSWKYRFHGINSIRIHGTEDRNFVIKNNQIGSLISGGSQKGIHIHGTSLSGRDLDENGIADVPSQGFNTNDEGLISLAEYGDRSNEGRVMRKNFKLINNTLIGHHISAIDFEGEQLNAEIKNNTISQTKDLFYVPNATSSSDSGIGIRFLSETSPIDIFNLFGSGTAYNLDFVGYAKNIKIQDNNISDGYMGIAFFNNQNDLALDYDNFPLAPASPINTNYNCEAGTSPVLSPRCSSQLSIIGNTISRIKANPNSINHQLQAYCLFMSNTVGAEIVNNIFNTCNIPETNYIGSPSAVFIVNSRKIFMSGNLIQVDNDTVSARQSLTLNTTNGWNRYYSIRTQGRAATALPFRSASWSVFSRLIDNDFLIQGYANTGSVQTGLKFNIYGHRLSDLQRLTPESATTGVLFLNENLGSQPSEYKFNNSNELNNLLE